MKREDTQRTNRNCQPQDTRKLTLLTIIMIFAPDLTPYESRVAVKSVRDRPAAIEIKQQLCHSTGFTVSQAMNYITTTVAKQQAK